jgi:hypothetical protein
MSSEMEIPLAEVEGWSPELVEKLAQNWITTADQVVAICANSAGEQAMAEQLNITVVRLRELVQAARKRLAPTVAQELEQPVDPNQYGLGAIKPRH